MQLGTRWPIGGAAPSRIPEPMRAAIRGVEAELADSDQPTAGWSWTLTFLEGKPLVDLDDGTRIRMSDGEVALVTSIELDEASEDE
jgi:predicted secreted protein